MPEPKVFLKDDLSPEDVAMLQALYSRSAESATVHLEKVHEQGSAKFCEKFYVGYNHKSIGDCGTTTLFFEGVSMLAAKAIQDWALYSGQETSTRYLDMSKQAIIDPVATPESADILQRWMAFYTEAQKPVSEHVCAQYPRKPGEDETTYARAVKARTFDILRGFLPAGITTQLSWHTNLRQGADKLALLRHHPLAEVRNLGSAADNCLVDRYPSSFGHKTYPETEEYRGYVMHAYNYDPSPDPLLGREIVLRESIDARDVERYADLFERRPPKTELPAWMDELGHVQYSFLLDFGSFRDIQRHRHGVVRMPLLRTYPGFEPWYIEQLPTEWYERALTLIHEQSVAIDDLPTDPTIRQYYIAMGYQVPVRVTWGIPAAVYVMELRSAKVIHPTLRRVVHRMIVDFKESFPIIKLHVDLDPDDWDVRRGAQTITAKI